MAKELLTDGEAVVGGLYVKHGPSIQQISQTFAAADFADGLSAAGTKAFTAYLPKGALVLGGKVVVTAGFIGDISAVMKVGDGSTTDRFNTSTINVFAAAANGIDLGVPSGVRYVEAAVQPVVTVTSNSDFTPVLAGGGSMLIELYYINTFPE